MNSCRNKFNLNFYLRHTAVFASTWHTTRTPPLSSQLFNDNDDELPGVVNRRGESDVDVLDDQDLVQDVLDDQDLVQDDLLLGQGLVQDARRIFEGRFLLKNMSLPSLGFLLYRVSLALLKLTICQRPF